MHWDDASDKAVKTEAKVKVDVESWVTQLSEGLIAG